MTVTPSTMLPLGTAAPDFNLPDVVTGKYISLKNYSHQKALMVMFICRHCPYVRHVKNELGKLAKDYKDKDIGLVAISSNDADKYPEDAPESLREFAETEEYGFPILFDEAQAVAKVYTAACTPDFFLFDKHRRLVYRGQLDGSRPGNFRPVTGQDLRSAIEAVLNDRPVDPEQRPSSGCNIKWKMG